MCSRSARSSATRSSPTFGVGDKVDLRAFGFAGSAFERHLTIEDEPFRVEDPDTGGCDPGGGRHRSGSGGLHPVVGWRSRASDAAAASVGTGGAAGPGGGRPARPAELLRLGLRHEPSRGTPTSEKRHTEHTCGVRAMDGDTTGAATKPPMPSRPDPAPNRRRKVPRTRSSDDRPWTDTAVGKSGEEPITKKRHTGRIEEGNHAESERDADDPGLGPETSANDSRGAESRPD